jgi:hypothetical protein
MYSFLDFQRYPLISQRNASRNIRSLNVIATMMLKLQQTMARTLIKSWVNKRIAPNYMDTFINGAQMGIKSFFNSRNALKPLLLNELEYHTVGLSNAGLNLHLKLNNLIDATVNDLFLLFGSQENAVTLTDKRVLMQSYDMAHNIFSNQNGTCFLRESQVEFAISQKDLLFDSEKTPIMPTFDMRAKCAAQGQVLAIMVDALVDCHVALLSQKDGSVVWETNVNRLVPFLFETEHFVNDFEATSWKIADIDNCLLARQ